MDIPTNGLKSLSREFRNHLTHRFKPPWASTASVLNYLELDVVEVYLRGDQAGEDPATWYLQLSFSGCAGMAEISAEVSAHWAEKWYVAENERITTVFLQPHGFEPDGRTERVGFADAFAPIGTAGYATFTSTPRELESEQESTESRYFDLDVSALEAMSENERAAAVRALDNVLLPLLPGGACRCQWCAPTLDVGAIDRVVPFK